MGEPIGMEALTLIRTLEKKVELLDKTVDAIGKTVEAVSLRVDAMSDNMDVAGTMAREAEERAAVMGRRLDVAMDAIGALEKKVDAVGMQVAGIEGKVYRTTRTQED